MDRGTKDTRPLTRVEIDDEALAEARDAKDYYAQIHADLGANFVQCLDVALERIASHPMLWPPFSDRTRRYLMDRFPYGIVYRVVGDTVRVLAVMHQHRRPGYWAHRSASG